MTVRNEVKAVDTEIEALKGKQKLLEVINSDQVTSKSTQESKDNEMEIEQQVCLYLT